MEDYEPVSTPMVTGCKLENKMNPRKLIKESIGQ